MGYNIIRCFSTLKYLSISLSEHKKIFIAYRFTKVYFGNIKYLPYQILFLTLILSVVVITLKQVAKSIEPKWEINDWFQWPPNLFALISIILQRTGAYRICLVENAHWENISWVSNVKKDGEEWIKYTSSILEGGSVPPFEEINFQSLNVCYAQLKTEWNDEKIDLNKLRILNDQSVTYDNMKNKRMDFAEALVSILAIADSGCAGLGIIGSGVPELNDDNSVFRTFANLLLTTTGSVSTILKFHGAVVPKMRTPQSGIVLRSLSHHLTFHQTEVDVVWRTFPLLDNNKQHLNILVVPFPYEIYKTDFEALEDKFHHHGYFKGKIQQEIHVEFLDKLVTQVFRKTLTNNEIDLLIFPEMSLSEPQYNYLLNSLASRYFDISDTDLKYHNDMEYCNKLPIVIAGVLNQKGKDGESKLLAMDNEARIAVFFAGRWYDITQTKHHRWQLDRSQVQQYGLEGYLSADKNWIEYCNILQRRLTILAPNGWLSLTALICEDLARQEPVGEVIRGIGPTLLTALLSDGPQINQRWSARYASVLADDPGTSVLSVTSKGMSKRSRKPDGTLPKPEEPLAIGLWKDLIKGWTVLELEQDMDALMFTVSSKFEKEFTIDGRSDNSSSSVFRMDSVKPKQVKIKDNKKHDYEKVDSNGEDQSNVEDFTKSDNFQNWYGIRSLSVLTFTIDALVDLISIYQEDSIVSAKSNLIFELYSKRESGTNAISRVKQAIRDGWENPQKIGISTNKNHSDNSSAVNSEAVRIMDEIVKETFRIKAANNNKTIFEAIIDACIKQSVSKHSDIYLRETIPMIFVYNINSKLLAILDSSRKTDDKHGKQSLTISLKTSDAIKISKQVKSFLKTSILKMANDKTPQGTVQSTENQQI